MAEEHGGKRITKVEQRGELFCMWFDDGTAIRAVFDAVPEEAERLVGCLFVPEEFPGIQFEVV